MAGDTDEGVAAFQCVHVHTFTSGTGGSRGKRVSFSWLKVPYFQISSDYACGEFKSRITGITDVVKATLRLACIGYILGAANGAGNLNR